MVRRLAKATPYPNITTGRTGVELTTIFRYLKRMLRLLFASVLALAAVDSAASSELVRSINPPTEPLPPETDSAGVTRFSFIVYGDTRGRRDGRETQYEHSLVVDSMLATITRMKRNGDPVRFMLQTGDAVVDGRDPRQWNASFVSIINRITSDGGIPYYLAPGNHDVTEAAEISSTDRHKGLTNYLAAMAHLIPPNGSVRRLHGYPTFAFGYGNSFFLALDSNIAADRHQYYWTVRQLDGLDRNRYKNVFAFFHHPPFSSGNHGGRKVEVPSRDIRKFYMPLFRQHEVRAIFVGHEHLFEHWVERWIDPSGRMHRMDQIVTGGGGAPIGSYEGEPDTSDYINADKAARIELQHLVRPGPRTSDNPYHYVLVLVNGTDIRMEVIGVDWGSDFKPYRSNSTSLQ
jgi:hypothetical protein